jgi:hypothetical protein
MGLDVSTELSGVTGAPARVLSYPAPQTTLAHYSLSTRRSDPAAARSRRKCKLGRRPRLEPRRAREHLRPYREGDDDARTATGHLRIAGDEHGRRLSAPGLGERPTHERRHTARRDAHHDVAGARAPPDLPRPGRPVVLGALHGPEDGAAPAGDDGLDQPRRCVEGGWALGGFDHPEPTAGAGPDEDEPAAP